MVGNVYFIDIKNVDFNDNLINELPLYCQNK